MFEAANYRSSSAGVEVRWHQGKNFSPCILSLRNLHRLVHRYRETAQLPWRSRNCQEVYGILDALGFAFAMTKTVKTHHACFI
jgi:hypothetical protein